MVDTASTTSGALMSLVRQCASISGEIVTALKTQKQLLNERGMTLPPLVSSVLEDAAVYISDLQPDLLAQQTELEQLKALADLSMRITTSLDVDVVLQETMDLVISLAQAERGFIILRDDAAQDGLDFRIARYDEAEAENRANIRATISRSVIDDVIASGNALLTDNAYKDERFQDRASIARLTLRSVLCVPLNYHDRVVGVVYVDNRMRTGIFTDREKATLTAFANTAAVALENARMYAGVRRTLDEITQVKELMDNVFASAGSGIIATDADGVVTTFSPAAERILGRTEELTLGKPLVDIFPKITADFADYVTAVRERGESHTLDGEILTADRRRIALSIKLTPLKDGAAKTRGVAVVVDDVTARLEREAQLRVMKTYLPPEMVDNIHTISNLALGGVRRVVTCMFVEVRPFKTLQNVAPVDVMNILNRYLSVATDVIHSTQGVIDKYMGSEIMALYNSQLNPQENHAEQALSAALKMREAFIELYRQEGIDPQPHYYRIGMHTGVATLGNVGSLNRRDFTAIGDTINLSKRLEENATRGQIIISQECREQLRTTGGDESRYRFVELSPVQVKGRQQKTVIYEVFQT